MNHDPLCPTEQCCAKDEEATRQFCECALIARTRADERDRAAQRPRAVIGIEILPCSRGMNSASVRGYHYFQKNEFGVVCVYCGKEPS